MTTFDLRTPLLALAFATAAVPACDAEEPAFGAGEVDARCPFCNGVKLNTNKFNDHFFSELDLNGDKHDGVYLESVELPRHGKLDQVMVEQGQILGLKNGHHYGGDAFQSSVWNLRYENPDPNHDWFKVTMRITKVTSDPYYGWKYTFEHNVVGGPKEYSPNCDKDEYAANGEQFDAIVTGNVTVKDDATFVDRPDTMFIGCLSGGVGKAGYWGYPRHKVGDNQRFTTAVRMVRADYCGTGHSFTEPGQAVTMTDRWGINQLVNGYTLEALWSDKGASCVLEPRLVGEYKYEDVKDACQELTGRKIDPCDPYAGLGSDPSIDFVSATP